VHVHDTTAPVADAVSLPAISGQCSVPLPTAPTATDNCDGTGIVGVPNLTGPFGPGNYTIIWTYTDSEGNSSSQNQSITVLPYSFNGFLAPVGGENGQCGDTVRTFKVGSTIPFKFIITCDGSPVLTGVHTISVLKCSGGIDATDPVIALPTDAATTGNQFRLTDGQWHFNLSTKTGYTQGSYKVTATLADGSSHYVYISLKK
jgi:hypothetical protein